MLEQLQESKAHFQGMRQSIRQRLWVFRENRTNEAQKALSNDFEAVLMAWGIETKTAIPLVICDLWLRCFLFTIPLVVSVFLALFGQNILALLSFILFLLPCLFGVLTSLWRISVLRYRHFMPFSCWLLSVFYLPNNKGNSSC